MVLEQRQDEFGAPIEILSTSIVKSRSHEPAEPEGSYLPGAKVTPILPWASPVASSEISKGWLRLVFDFFIRRFQVAITGAGPSTRARDEFDQELRPSGAIDVSRGKARKSCME